MSETTTASSFPCPSPSWRRGDDGFFGKLLSDSMPDGLESPFSLTLTLSRWERETICRLLDRPHAGVASIKRTEKAGILLRVEEFEVNGTKEALIAA